MTNRFAPVLVPLMLAASAAWSQEAALGRYFDGRPGKPGIGSLSPESVLPVIRETKESLPPAKKESALPIVASAGMVPVAVEVFVPAAQQQPQAVAQRVVRLAADHRFAPDAAFDPVRLPQLQIMPYPPMPNQRNLYLLRGVVPAARMDALSQDESIRRVWVDRSADEKGLEETFFRLGDKLKSRPGVKDVYLGFDCGIREPHQHIVAHHPAIVVVLDGTVARGLVRQSVFQDFPSLALEPIVFVDPA